MNLSSFVIFIMLSSLDSSHTSGDNTVVTELIKEKILESKAQSRIKAETIGEVVQRILLAPDRTVTVKLKNGIEFVERMK